MDLEDRHYVTSVGGQRPSDKSCAVSRAAALKTDRRGRILASGGGRFRGGPVIGWLLGSVASQQQQVLGRYTLERVLGKGAMGIVYEAFDPKLNRRVAIKTVRRNPLDEQAAKDYSARFVREAQASARLNHPNIVQIHDFGEEGDVAYLVMELIRGKELQGYFGARERFDVKVAVGIMRELCDALEFAHRAGIVHRDVKPANVMLNAQGSVKLTDFGVARVEDAAHPIVTQGDTLLVGTPAYMSPEQIGGGSVDQRSDVFSAGVILYQLLTGELPFSGGGPWTIAKKIMQEQPTVPSSTNAALTPLFDAVVAKALAKNREDRYQSARALALALECALEGRAEADDGAKAAPRMLAIAAALGLAVAAVVGVGMWYAAKKDAPAPEAKLEQPPAEQPRAAEPSVAKPAASAVPDPEPARRPAAEKVEVGAPAAAGFPRAGDSWTYRLTQPDRTDDLRQQRYTVGVAAVSETSISDRYTLEGGQSGRARHRSGSYLTAPGPALFSPYLPLFEELSPGAKLRSIAVRDGACPPDYTCFAEGRVAGRETVQVPAGSFDTIKVSVEESWQAASAASGAQAGQMSGGRTLTIWYAPQAKRAVKYRSRLTFGNVPPIDANFDLELVSYQLRQ